MGDRDADRPVGGRRLDELIEHRGEHARRTSHAGDRDDVVDEPEDRSHPEQSAHQRLGPSDAAAALEVVERLDAEVAVHALRELRAVRDDVLDRRARGEQALDAERAERGAGRRRARVDHGDAIAERRGGEAGRLHRGRERAGDVHGDDVRVGPVEQLLVAVGEGLGRRRGGPRRLVRQCEPGVEGVRIEIDVVAQIGLVTEAHGQRHHAQVREALGVVGQIGGRVDHDRRVLCADHGGIMKHGPVVEARAVTRPRAARPDAPARPRARRPRGRGASRSAPRPRPPARRPRSHPRRAAR